MIGNVHFVELVELNKYLMISDQTNFLRTCSNRRALRSEHFRLSEQDQNGTPSARTARCCPFQGTAAPPSPSMASQSRKGSGAFQMLDQYLFHSCMMGIGSLKILTSKPLQRLQRCRAWLGGFHVSASR
ncbi:hypothetical protein RHMOL_Rhmol05G0044700 [Rhododendron molle]|uniref:Uncharacterized protein n=1 Tax=Rhododendron molle TaxID=49168 RepID=A0ACC0NKA9_RHOML|nr:hypothetical protein RHMOL_Rhmol05G0044700 [Rhododendron molle]